MRKTLSFELLMFLVISCSALAGLSQISYQLTDLGSGRWQYIYEVSNFGMPDPIEEVTIYFDHTSCRNLAIETLSPLSGLLDELVFQPDLVINDDGAYDALFLTTGVPQGQKVSGFAVSFDWLGQSLPGAQFYEIMKLDPFETIDWGYTIPEPATILIFLAGIWSQRKRMFDNALQSLND